MEYVTANPPSGDCNTLELSYSTQSQGPPDQALPSEAVESYLNRIMYGDLASETLPPVGQPISTENHMSNSCDGCPTPYGGHTQNLQLLGEAQNVLVPTMGPPIKSRKRKAPTLRAEVWNPYKDRIAELHIEQNLSLQEVRDTIEKEFGFTAEIRQYRTRISQWGLDKKVKPHEMKAIVRKRQQRKLVESDKGELRFVVRGNVVGSRKVDRWMKKNGIAESTVYAPSPTASTPSAVGCETISERGSPVQRSVCFAGSPIAAQNARPDLLEASPVSGLDFDAMNTAMEIPFSLLDIELSSTGTGTVEGLLGQAQTLTLINDEWVPAFAPRKPSSASLSQQLEQAQTTVWASSNAEMLLPMRWSKENKAEQLQLDENDLVVELPEGSCNPTFFTETWSDGVHHIFKGGYSVRTDTCISTAVGEYYFEIEIISDGGSGFVAVGFEDSDLEVRSIPGWRANSYGYHGDDGRKLANGKRSVNYAAQFTAGDVVGCGINFVDCTAYFTKNGVSQGIAFENVWGEFYPVVGLNCAGARVKGRFGLVSPTQQSTTQTRLGIPGP